ncbi:tRNA (mnm(5)s(2)U34)-methyltransferase [Cerasicoccus frondis]|uniref:tRNA (mnm(5)s(2)U34)-methyltransferase n=1 Tax=Cerasicoccus frondis TaxID=490090 RepID=UPI002852B345|nr:class I SAM-dependent methyltransferase [Cerasicoccus frondis]
MPRLTHIVHEQLDAVLQPGDYAIDATAGNGHDTLFLAQKVGKTGLVLGIDRQNAALKTTAQRLTDAQQTEQVKLIQADHADMLEVLPGNWLHRVKAIVFNLGYLPGSDKEVITQAESTRMALDTSIRLLAPGGLLSVLIYRGHEGGHDEERMITRWLTEVDGAFAQVEWNDGEFPTETSPRLLSCYR